MSEQANPYFHETPQERNGRRQEADLFFDQRGRVWRTLRRLAMEIDELGMPYAVLGDLAMFLHGFRRLTSEVELLLREEHAEQVARRLGLQGKASHQHLQGAGWTKAGSLALADVDTRIVTRIYFAGATRKRPEAPPYVHPDPAQVAVNVGGFDAVDCPNLLNMLLLHRRGENLRDHADAMQLIQHLCLRESLVHRLDPRVQESYRRMWRMMQEPDPHGQGGLRCDL